MEAILRLLPQLVSSTGKLPSFSRRTGSNRQYTSVAVGVVAILAFCMAADGLAFAAADSEDGKPETEVATDSKLYLKIRLDGAVKVSALKPGDIVEGALSRDIYCRDRQVFPAGSRVRLTVDRLGRRRRVPNDHWPWVVQFFTPRHENYPIFQFASILPANGVEVPLRVSLISISNEREVLAQMKAGTKKDGGKRDGAKKSDWPVANGTAGRRAAGPTVTLEATRLTSDELTAAASSENLSAPSAPLAEPVTLAAGTPEGSLFQGTVVKRTPPRMLSRPGSLLVTFTGVTLPGGNEVPVVASVTGAVLDRRSHTKIDPEGQLRGDRPGKVWMLVNAGVTAGIAKEVDDGTQLVIEAIVSSATNASTAGVSRIVATCASVLFMVTRHGRDVVLPRSTEMDIVFDRSVSLSPRQSPGTR